MIFILEYNTSENHIQMMKTMSHQQKQENPEQEQLLRPRLQRKKEKTNKTAVNLTLQKYDW